MKKQDYNDGWKTETKKCNKLQESREKLFKKFRKNRAVRKNEKLNNKILYSSSKKTKDTLSYGDEVGITHGIIPLRSIIPCELLKKKGVVFFKNLFPTKTIQYHLKKSIELSHFVNTLDWDFTNKKRPIFHLDGTEKNKCIEYCLGFSKGRYDITTSKMITIEIPLIIKKCLDHLLQSCHYKVQVGYVPVLPQTKEGPYHRDSKALFSWNTKDTNEADKKDITIIPDYYYTLLINLNDEPNDVEEIELGNTEFIVGSHQTSILDSINYPSLINKNYKAGDCALFNGKIIHRGLANKSKSINRHALYVTFTADWYNDS
jgi:hypothetical protein